MAFTDTIAVAATPASSAFRTVAPGSVERVGLRGAASGSVPSDARVAIEYSTNTTNTIVETYETLTSTNKTTLIAGPTTYRTTRIEGNVGVYVES